MKGYVGRRTIDGCEVFVVTETARQGLQREPLKHRVIHSPDGFEWGYGGSGPSDLALSILADWLGEDPSPKELSQGRFEITDEMFEAATNQDEIDALIDRSRLWCVRYHQKFKQDIVAKMAGDAWKLEGGTIAAWIEKERVGEKIRGGPNP